MPSKRRNSEEVKKSQVKGQRSSSSKRKVLSPGNQTEKKQKHTDKDSVASSEGSAWCDIEDSEFKLNELDFDPNMTDVHDLTFGNNQCLNSPQNYHISSLNSTVLNTGQPIMVPQHVLGAVPGMPSPILTQQSTATLLTDNDVYRIATVLKSVIHDEIALMIDKKVDEQTKSLKEEITLLKNENVSLRQSISSIEMNVDRQEQYSRKLCARISNYGFEAGENTDQIVQDVAKSCHINIKPDEIDRSHRVGKPNVNRPKEIIVKFKSLDSKVKFLKCRKELRKQNSYIFINEDLTKFRNDLLYKCRLMKKNVNSSVEKTWSFNGNVYIQAKGQTEAVQIQNEVDLQRFST